MVRTFIGNGANRLLNLVLFRNKNFIKLWIGQGVSLFGSLVSRLALPFFVIYTMSASPTQVALLRVCELVPGIAVGLFAGVWVDRLKRRQVMIFSDVVRALLVGSIPLLLFIQQLGWIQVMLVAAMVSIFTVSFDSAYGAYIPTLVEDDQIMDANAKLSATGAVAEVAGFGISGALFELLGGALTMSIDAISFLISAFTLMGIRKSESRPQEPEKRKPLLQELRQGLCYLRKDKTLSLLAGISGIQNVFYGISGTVYILYISRELHVAPGIQGVLYAVGGIGAFVTSNFSDALFRRIGLGKAFIFVSLLGVIGNALLPLALGPTWLLITFILGQQLLGDGADTIFEIGVAGFRQAHTSNVFLGRVNSIWQVLTWVCILAGTLIGGELAAFIGLKNTLFIAIAVRIVGLALPSLSHLRKVDQYEVPAEQQ